MIRFATIGTNFVVDWFVEAARQCEGLVYQAAYSRKPETAKAFAEKHGAVRISTDLEELASAKDVEAVYIASPNSLHFEQAALMMSHGKHVLCEKTITSNEQELLKLLEIGERNHVVIMEAMRLVFDQGFARIQENLPRLGRIRRVSFQFGKYSSRYDKFKAGIVENAFNPAFSNGALMDIGVYCVHPLVKLFGMPEKIMADALILENGIDGAGTILAKYDGMQAELLYSKISDNHLASQIQGEEGTMVIEGLPSPTGITIFGRSGESEEILCGEQESNMVGEARAWAELIESGESAEPYTRYSVMELKVMDEARRQLGIVFPADKEERWKNY